MPDPEIEIDREYNVPLTRAWIAPRHRRAVRAVNVLREFAQHHMKSVEIKIDSELNERIWNRGMTRPPRHIAVRMTKDDDGLVTISLPKKAKVKEEVSKPQEALPAPKEEPPKPVEEPQATQEKQEGKPAEAKLAKEPSPEPKKSRKKPAKKKATRPAAEKKKKAALKKKRSKK